MDAIVLTYKYVDLFKLTDMQEEHGREREALLESIRELHKDLSQQVLIIQSYIPQDQLELIERNVSWNEDIGEFQLVSPCNLSPSAKYEKKRVTILC